MSAEITTRTAVYTRRADGIIVQRALPDVTQTIADARENIAVFNRLANGRPHLVLVDLRAFHGQEPGVRDLYASEESTRYATALAILAQASGPGRVLVNLFFRFTSPSAPTRLFTDEEQAVAWLHKVGRALSRNA